VDGARRLRGIPSPMGPTQAYQDLRPATSPTWSHWPGTISDAVVYRNQALQPKAWYSKFAIEPIDLSSSAVGDLVTVIFSADA
jgi:hypothetical protein